MTEAKTYAGIRTMKVPTVLQPLAIQGAGAWEGSRSDRLFPGRGPVLGQALGSPFMTAGVRTDRITAGLRGTHGRLAVEAGISDDVVAASLGHESFAVTEKHYAGRDAVAGARIDRVAAALY